MSEVQNLGIIQSLKNRKSRTPYLLLIPGIGWLFFFFLFPLSTLLATSLQKPAGASPDDGFLPAFKVSNYSLALVEYYPQFIRAFTYSAIATVVCLLLAYPIAYYMAFRARKYRNLMLVLIVAPFFASFLLRTNAWKTILSGDGFVVTFLNSFNLLPQGRILNTSIAVIAGLVYNFLPFMILPLYTSLEKIDSRLIEAAGDLYSPPSQSFWKVVWPLSLPGVVSGTLLTFIPASGDYINAELLGSINNKMIGNVIQSQFIDLRDYPTASALSFTFMAIILVMIYLYIRKAGTEQLV
ncbi:MAG: ABC transporter permease [Candidatus Nanopelagicales bacterium]|jgi:spermidine/putrescine transport system permease protein